MEGDIWAEVSAYLYLTDEDFEEEFGRPRTPEEAERHKMFVDAASLAEPDTTLIMGGDNEDGEGEVL